MPNQKDNLNGVVFFTALVILASLYVIKIFNISYPVAITTTAQSSELSVVGEGKVDVVPDVAYINLGITVNGAATVNEARANIDGINNRIIEAMKKLGIAKKDIKTTNYSVNPNYIYENNENKIKGYNGNASLTIKVLALDNVTQVIELASQAGANEIQGTSFVVDKPEKYREEARNKAIKNAQEQAVKLTQSLGIKLGKVTNIIESGGTPQIMPMYDRAAVMNTGLGGGSTPSIEPGSQTITSVVTLYFEKR